jgi:hypothetical protein
MAVHHALGLAGRAGRVVDGEQCVLVLEARLDRQHFGAGHELLVAAAIGARRMRFIRDLDDLLDTLDAGERIVQVGRELGVDQQDARPRVLDDVGDLGRGQARVDRDQRSAEQRHAEGRGQVDRRIGQQHRDGVAVPYAGAPQRSGQPSDLFAEARVAPLLVPVDDADPFAEDVQGAGEQVGGGQRVGANVRRVDDRHELLRAAESSPRDRAGLRPRIGSMLSARTRDQSPPTERRRSTQDEDPISSHVDGGLAAGGRRSPGRFAGHRDRG